MQELKQTNDTTSDSRFKIIDKSLITNEIVVFGENINVSFKFKPKKADKINYEFSQNSVPVEQRVPWKEYQNLNKTRKILKGVDFYLKQGETLALIGANGAGKTVLVETLLGIIEKQSGEIYLNLGRKTFEENLEEVGIQYQHSKFPKNKLVKDILETHRKIYGNRTTDDQFNEMISEFDILPFYGLKAGKISGGQAQRLNLLISIMHNPKLMILDEFITGLDVKSVKKIITYVNKLKIRNKATMIIISHQPEEIEQLSDRIIVLNDGIITIETSTKDVLKRYSNMASFIERSI